MKKTAAAAATQSATSVAALARKAARFGGAGGTASLAEVNVDSLIRNVAGAGGSLFSPPSGHR